MRITFSIYFTSTSELKSVFFSAQFNDEKRDAVFQGRYAKRGTIFQWKVRGAFSIMNGWSKGLDRGEDIIM